MTADVPVPAGQHTPPAEAIEAALAVWHDRKRAALQPRTSASGYEERFLTAILEAAAPLIAAQAAAAERERWVTAIAERTTTLQRPGPGRNIREGVDVVLIRDIADLLEGGAP